MNEQKQRGVIFGGAGKSSKMQRASWLLLFGALLLSALGIAYSQAADGSQMGGQSIPSTTRAAVERFWATYHGNDYDAIPDLEVELTQAIEADPNNATLDALLGAAHFWHFGEYTRDPNATQAVLGADISSAVQLFQKALNLDYYGRHLIGYVNDDHLPGYWGITMAHAGQLTNDPNLVAQADQVLNYAVYQFPEFNSFNRWAAHNTDPKDSDTYKSALESLWQGIDECIQGTLDRSNPDLKPYLQLYTRVGRKKACWWDGDIAPYSFEGYLLNLGNGLVKAGQIETAKVIYADAKYAANYNSWPYRYVLEAIANSDLNARAALYSDNDAGNDPPLGVPNRGCVYCHATVSEPGPRGSLQH